MHIAMTSQWLNQSFILSTQVWFQFSNSRRMRGFVSLGLEIPTKNLELDAPDSRHLLRLRATRSFKQAVHTERL